MESGYVITIPKTSEAIENGKPFTVFTISITGGKGRSVSHSVERRFHNFRNFDMDWRRIYGATIGDRISLPSQKDGFLTSKQGVIESRRRALQKYLQDLVGVACVQPMVLSFCGVEVGGKHTDEMLDPNDFDDTKPRGNNLQASEKALAEKMAFMDKNRELLHQLMPGFSQPLSFEALEIKRDVLNPNQRNPTAGNRALAAVLSGIMTFKRSADPSTMPFQKRYCVFVGCQIGYYGSENDTVPVGTVVLSKHSVIKREPEDKTAKFVFSVTPQVGKMFYLFSAPDSETFEKWISVLEKQVHGGFDSEEQKGMLSGKMRVLKTYTPAEDEKTCVEIKKGETVTVTNRDDPAWFFGTTAAGAEGYFPSDCLQVPLSLGTSTANFSRVDTAFSMAEQLKAMTQGANFLKFPFKSKGKPKKMSVFYRPNADSNSNKGCLFYCPLGEREMNFKRCLILNHIAEVITGKGTAVFSGRLEYSEHLCFSMNYLTPETNTPRTLDLMADTRQIRDDWVRALREIVAPSGGEFRAITIAMAAEKPEAIKSAPKPLKALPPTTKRPPPNKVESKQDDDAPPLPPRPQRSAHSNAAAHAAVTAQRKLTVQMAQEAGGDRDRAQAKLAKLALPQFKDNSAEDEEARDKNILKARTMPPPSRAGSPPPKLQQQNSASNVNPEPEEKTEEPAAEAPAKTPKGPGPKPRVDTEEEKPAEPAPKTPGRALPAGLQRRGPPLDLSRNSNGPPVGASPDEPPATTPKSPTSPSSRGPPPPAGSGRAAPPAARGRNLGDGEKCNKCGKSKSAPGLKFCPCGGMFG